jgi:glyoxylase-like metal-dependent hydrolase (beta-lactamase superfamily II)
MPRALPSAQVSGLYRIRIGNAVVTAINDGMLEGSFDFLADCDGRDAAALHAAQFRPVPPRLTVNTFLLHLGERLALVDGGCGGALGPGLGLLIANLAAAGVAAENIDTVLATHLHPDHVGGLVGADGTAVFPKAELVVHAAEPAFWQDDAMLARASEQDRGFFQLARAALTAYRGRLRTFTQGDVLPGVAAVPEPGHTPGHTGYRIGSGVDGLLIWGDIVHMPGIQFARPEVGMTFDVDRAQAAATRRRILEMAAAERLRVAGMHLDFPAFGHVARAGDAYSFIPEVWSPAL